ncbi:MAG: HNH endonuclease [Candidatus Gastranaerophilales bacterium]|nr:HNH endonuclease [Candidatus Gastranaerophilales bacterium]
MMNLNGINSVQPSLVFKTKEAEKPAENQQVQTTSAEPKKSSDAGCLKNYFAGSVNFGGHHCKTSNFEVKKLPDVPCCCCGKPMLRENDLQECKKAVAGAKGEHLAATIDEYSKYMRADEKCAATIIADKVKETGGDVGQGMRATSQNLRELTGQYANGILDGLDKMAKEAFKEDENPMSSVIAKAREGIAQGRGLDRSTFVEQLEKAGGRLGEEAQAKIQDAAMDLPQTFNHVQRIYDKYAGKKNEEIARRLFSTALTTAEHIHPHSLGGPDNTANYIAECAGCNNPRGNMDYAEWLKVHPEYPRKAQEHVEHVEARLINGEIGKDYNDWPIDVRASLSKESGGRMVLKVLNPSTIENMRRERGLSGKDVTVEDVRAAYEKQEAEKAENK